MSRLPQRLAFLIVALCTSLCTLAAPSVTRLTPPSELFRSDNREPVIARFLPGQRFDLQATVKADPGATITAFEFRVDGVTIPAAPAATSIVSGANVTIENGFVISRRAYSNMRPGVHTLSIAARQSDGQVVTATGNFEIVKLDAGRGPKVKNIILMLGDGMGAAHRTAARIVAKGYAQGKAKHRLAMDSFPVTGMVMTASLNSIVTDSSPGMSNYVTGNKADNNEEGVFPDDTRDHFDNPRVEYLSEYLHRTQGKKLGLVTTADVFDATPAANAVHTAERGAGTGIVDQYFDDRQLTGLSVLMGGGRKWFIARNSTLPPANPANSGNGSARTAKSDYVLPADIVAGWGAAKGNVDPDRDLIADFKRAGFAYAADKHDLDAMGTPDKLLGLFAYSNMNVAFDKIAGRRGTSGIVSDFGLPDQPMLDEMTDKALKVLAKDNPHGFYLMVEGASIDKQSHAMDSDRWIEDVIEFDRAIKVAQDFAAAHPDTLVLVTADHECSGAAIIGAHAGTAADNRPNAGNVSLYEAAQFPHYDIAPDGYPITTDVPGKLLIGYGANADRHETWRSYPQPTADSQQPFAAQPPLSSYPANPDARAANEGYAVTGQISGHHAGHTGTDIPLSAYGPGAMSFTGVFDNTDVFFKVMQLASGKRK